MTRTSFIFNSRLVAHLPVPIDHDSYASNLLRRQTAFFCPACGEIYARIVSSDPLFPFWTPEFNRCPACVTGPSWVFFNDYLLYPNEFKPGIQLLFVLPREILALELLARG